MTKVEPISVIRAAYLNRVTDVLRDSDRDFDKTLPHFNLPAKPTGPDAYIPLRAAVAFVHWAELNTGIRDLGLRAGARFQLADFNVHLRRTLRHAPTLESALQAFCRLAPVEQSGVHYRITREKDEVRIGTTSNTLASHAAIDCGEWFQIMSLVAIVRYFAGNTWSPKTIVFRSQRTPAQYAQRAFPHARFLTGQKETGIVFPTVLIHVTNAQYNPLHSLANAPVNPSAACGGIKWDFPRSLQELLQTYLHDGYPDVNFAAKLVGSSVRTLQRKLSHYNLKYSELVRNAQFEYARKLLADPKMRTLDVAYTVGYQDPSNFARAFRRFAGVTPREYRQQIAS